MPQTDADPAELHGEMVPLKTFPAEKQFFCQFCPKTFVSELELKSHNELEFNDYEMEQMRLETDEESNQT
jgi:hypothetical protein